MKETCVCQYILECPWSKEVSDLRATNPINKGYPQTLIDTNNCGASKESVWCCQNTKGESDFPVLEDLDSLNKQYNTSGSCINRDRNSESGCWKPDAIRAECGTTINDQNIVGGRLAKLGDFPYMAIIGYDNKKGEGQDVNYECGGSVINKWYVLTAAHCMYEGGFKNSTSGERKHPSEVIVGEYDLRSEQDCNSKGECAPSSITVKITNPLKQVIVHEDYIFTRTSVKNDISLIRLDEKLTLFTDNFMISYVKPVCLPWSQFDKQSDVKFARNIDGLEGKFATITGWGLFGSGPRQKNKSSINTLDCGASACKLFAGKTPINNIGCKERFPSTFDPNVHLCAGNEGSDAATCQGDSGGPIVISNGDARYQIGIVSFGTDLTCKRETRFFTRLQTFLPWIEKKLEP